MNASRDGLMLYRRRAHLVVWDVANVVTVPAWPLYWCDVAELTMVRVHDIGGERAYLPLVALRGYWDWYVGEVDGIRVYEGYGVHGMAMPRYERVRPSPLDCGSGWRYWLADTTYRPPDPDSHV